MDSISVVRFLVDLSLKSMALVVVAGLAALVFNRQSASVRSLVWTFCLGALVLLPFLTAIAPAWEVPVLPNIFAFDADIPEGILDESGAGAAPGLAGSSTVGTEEAELRDTGGLLAGLGLSWSGWIIVAWAAGMLLLLGWFVIGRGVLWWICSRAEAVREGPWISLLHSISEESAVSRPVRLFRSPMTTVAFTSGIRQPTMVLPEHAEQWTQDSLRFVMMHELAHVKRWDTLTEALAQIVTALYWYHPLAWLAARRLRVERERACDDVVLNLGSKPSDYASQLMVLASTVGALRRPLWQAAAISQGGSLKDRLLFILDPERNRTTARGLAFAVVASLMVAVAVPLAALTLWTPPPGIGQDRVDGVLKVMLNPAESPESGDGVRRHRELAVRLVDVDSKIREGAARTLGNIGDAAAMKILRSALESPDRAVQMTAMKELAFIGDPASARFFVETLQKEDSGNHSSAAAGLLLVFKVDHAKARAAAKAAIEEADPETFFDNFARALSVQDVKTRTWGATVWLKSLWDASLDIRLTALDAMGRQQDPQFLDAFTLLLRKSKEPKLRFTAVKAIGVLKTDDSSAGDALVKAALKDEHPAVRAVALDALVMREDPRARKVLEKALSDDDAKVRKTATKHLSELD